jgi:hypothetical protein
MSLAGDKRSLREHWNFVRNWHRSDIHGCCLRAFCHVRLRHNALALEELRVIFSARCSVNPEETESGLAHTRAHLN